MGMESFFVKIGFLAIEKTPSPVIVKDILKHLQFPIRERKERYFIGKNIQIMFETPYYNEIAFIGLIKDFDHCCQLIVDIIYAINEKTPIDYYMIMGKKIPFNKNMELISMIQQEYKEKSKWYFENFTGRK